MGKPVFYHMPLSPCSRGALLVARLVGVDVEVRNVDLLKGEHLKPEFIRVNPRHTIPTLDDNGFVIVDSHAIATYLAERYGKDEKLYPKDVMKRSVVDQMLHFDAGLLYVRLKDICFPVFFKGCDIIPNEKKEKVHEALGWLENFLKPTGWIAGENITIADAMCVSSVTTFIAEGFDLSKYPKVLSWISNCRKEIPDFDDIDTTGAEEFKKAFVGKLKPGEI